MEEMTQGGRNKSTTSVTVCIFWQIFTSLSQRTLNHHENIWQRATETCDKLKLHQRETKCQRTTYFLHFN